MDQPVFISGTQRSGTTLLCSMFNQLPRVHAQNELRWEIYDYLVADQPDLNKLRLLLQDFLRLDDAYREVSAAETSAFDLLAMAMRHAAARNDKTRWCVKDPHMTYYLDQFQKAFPKSWFVILVRDGRAVTNSYLRQKWYVANAYRGGLLWEKEVAIHRRFVEKHPDRALLVKYEDLVVDAEPVLQRVCDFIGERFDRSMLEYYRSETPISVNEYNENIRQPLQASMISKWRDKLSSRQVGIIEAVAGDSLDQLGYDLQERPVRPSRLSRAFYDLQQFVLVNYWWQKRARAVPAVNWLRRRFPGPSQSG